MKFTPSALIVSLEILVPIAAADFTVYYTQANGLMGSGGWTLFNGKPDCDQVRNLATFTPFLQIKEFRNN